MATIERRRVLPTTRSGTIGALLTAIAFVLLVVLIATNSRDQGVNPLAFTWALIALGGLIQVYAIARKGERSIVSFVALLPFALLVVLLGMEATGLME
jgi:lipid-A-disaccharide synthase-like uncharacterized protein